MQDRLELKHYLRRIGYEGTPRVDFETLRAVNQLHSDAITYENLDVQLGRRVGRDIPAIYEKIVGQGRGGWCYEQNGLLAWALGAIGFEVGQHAGGVMRAENGEAASVGNHLVLTVALDRPYLVDVGFGDGLIEPMPLATGSTRQRGYDFRLSETPDGWWRFHNHAHGAAPHFDFKTGPADETALDEKCNFLQSDPQSSFVLNAVCQRYQPDAHYTLRGKVLKTLRNGAFEQRLLRDARDYEATLAEVFDLRIPEAGELWRRIEARHAQLFPPTDKFAEA